ncbi:MAG TPA: nicotinamide riboside transporter PnuC [Chitinophagaceae bacterium]|nr:nicotinamide riboside transporter PnuC [Chitinophagaceae bacterium]
MTIEEFIQQFLTGIRNSSWMELVAVLAGIGSVWFSRIENVWVYPVGLINTVFYIYLSFKYHLPGEAAVNTYYTIMSIYGWYMWLKKDSSSHKPVLQISYSDKRMWQNQLLFFAFFYAALYFSLSYLKEVFFEGAIPWADAFASATAFTGMWLMTRKKIESWYWWMATNLASMPLYFVKGLVMTSVLYFVLLIMAVMGLMEWKRREKLQKAKAAFSFEN